MAKRNFTDVEELQIAHLYSVGGFSLKAIARTYGWKHHISFTSALKRQGIKQRSPAERNRLYQLNPHVFDKINNELATYWLGFIYADGCVHKRSLQVSLKTSDKTHLEKLKEFLESEAPIKHVQVGSGKTDKKYKQVLLLVTDKHLSNRLRNLGIAVGRNNFNNCISQIHPHLYWHWIRGLFDGDGSFHTRPGTSFVGDRNLLEFIRKTLANQVSTNPKVKIHKHPTAKIHTLVYGGRPQTLKIAKWLYTDATIWLDRKRQVVKNYPLPQIRTRNKLGQWE